MPLEKLLRTDGRAKAAQSGTSEVETCEINGSNRIVSHVPITREDTDAKEVTGVVSKVYFDDKLPQEIAQKWFSLGQQVQYYRKELEKRGEPGSFDQIVSQSSDFNIIKRDAKFVARSSSTVLLTGESGVGKDLFARAIHAASPRARRPFVKVNCAAIPETLFESELFGYAPGSFTGASKQGRVGYFEQAHEGTIFLDEIGDMPPSIQVKILQVIQDKQFIRVGGTSTQKVDVRIIAATNRNLQEAIAQGTFREDLFYRLNVISIRLTPLRDRPEDILPLAELFIEKYNHILGARVLGMSQEVKEALLHHNWPGNVRELENAIERAANYVWEGEIGIEHLPPHLFQSGKDPIEISPSYRETLGDVDKEIILNALKKAYGNKSAAARLLNISRSAFYDKLAKYGL
jgi:transcriptional regulator with PAS, ATPase and Fis domain